ncbi:MULTISPECIES: 50S ribosomal protein L25/general stress protein Ctc [Gluconobacter]|uniref:50S ribosomal protein L25/general stress protein Ctc n=1 Tax=Gluconobacter TaxID=441 RepID=UPI000A3711B8|nr:MULTISPECIES: 50S ribosomal protein L25/general stress protein Ctc [unclassified Gluconobacter]MBS1025958.1 50S ribosomal protein L25/general stress protein Ctc [Gluconobacter cerinus]MBS1038205.1 50S ribosomal protein L25/general stress protein Ctc [Gluconobacter cerinus]MBS1044230.1 50S ribosomal protein L25/general stress protein Ctc [Gluconobacter cerinus]MBS1069843.1 50S ribosomal protein L25/general stress protein Ctc [Gluconobacter cerinus]MBS1072543.1 50S ribosomal protein L25/gener
MANLTTLAVSTRAKAGKGAARATRRAGLVPAVIYGGKQEPSIIALDPRVIMKELHRGGWSSRVYNLAAEGAEPVAALIRDVQLHPVTDAPIHIDFQRVAAGTKVHVQVSIIFVGEEKAPGIKRGGVLNVVRHSVDVAADAASIPESFTVDLSVLDIHDSVRWSDLKGTEGVKLTGHQAADLVIASIAPPTIDAEMEAEAAAKAAAAAAAATAKPGAKKK